MRISVSEAKAQLTELVRLAEAGEDVVLTRHGHEAVRLVPVERPVDRERKKAILERIRASAVPREPGEADAARSQDFLYDEFGLPK